MCSKRQQQFRSKWQHASRNPGRRVRLNGLASPHRLRPPRAFSLVELMVVMVIIGLLATLVVFRTRSYLIASKQNAAKLEMARIVQGLDTFYATNDRYPTNEEGLAILAQPTATMVDGILSKVPLDPWKRPYQYNNPGRTGPYELICLGADGREGGEGADRDINNDELES